MAQLELIEAIEKRLWTAADTLRANSRYASNEYFLPVMGLIFLRHAYSRYLSVKDEIEAKLPTRGGKTRPLTKEDFAQKSSIYLRPEAQFDFLVNLPDSEERAKAIINAMVSIESDYESLHGILPKNEYQELDNSVLGQLLRTLNPNELKHVEGDVFGRIYEYFLTQFADQKAHDDGEFFTPISLVSFIANVLEPSAGIVLDPACGSGGMFVQSAKIIERQTQNPNEKLTFKGLEKNAITIRLAKMNLAVHGLEGNIQQAITYYEDPHELLGKAAYVMANPPFNVKEINAKKIENDPRLSFGLPSVNNAKKVSNGNYIWISYFYSYLNEIGRAGFVMSSQASSAGNDEAIIRQKLVETGDVEAMVAIGSNFFYTRTVPCELWFFNRNKAQEYKNSVLMLDARNIYRKVTRKINDFSPEQEQNLLAIVWLYRGQTDRFLNLVAEYCQKTVENARLCFVVQKDSENGAFFSAFTESLNILLQAMKPFMATLGTTSAYAEVLQKLETQQRQYDLTVKLFEESVNKNRETWKTQNKENKALHAFIKQLIPLVTTSRSLAKEVESQFKLCTRLFEMCEKEYATHKHKLWKPREVNKARKIADTARQELVEQLKSIRYFYKNALWLTERFPQAQLCDVAGLVKLVDYSEIAANDWSLTPGRYVGVAPEEVDQSFDFEEALRHIHEELEHLNDEAVRLAATIKKNFEELGI